MTTDTLTAEAVLKMPAGAELNALVAERVFGYKVSRIKPDWYRCEVVLFHNPHTGLIDYSWDANACNAMMYRNGRDRSDDVAKPLPCFSDPDMDLHEAWSVVEEMAEKGFGISLHAFPGHKVAVCFSHRDGVRTGVADGETMQLAVCRAALVALMDSEPKGGADGRSEEGQQEKGQGVLSR